MDLVKWDSFDGLNRMQSRMNELFDEVFGRSPMVSATAGNLWHPAVDILESHDAYLVRAELPGMKKDDVRLEVREGTLTLSGERKFDEPAKGVEYRRSERTSGKFSRSFYLPQKIKQDDIKASFRDGILEIHIPKVEEAKAKQIPILVN